MSLLECYLAAEIPRDGKPFTVTKVSTWYYIAVSMARSEGILKENAERIYNAFLSDGDKNEEGATLNELRELSLVSNGGIRIIPKTKDDFIHIDEWR